MILCLILFAAASQALDCPEGLEIGLDPTQIKSITAEVAIQGSGEVTGDLKPGEKITLKVLSFRETEEQEILELSEKLFVGTRTYSATPEEDEFGNRFAVFEITSLPSDKFSYELVAKVRTDYFSPLRDYDLSKEITSYSSFTQPTEYIESNEASIRTLQTNQFKTDSALEFVRDVANWTHDYVEYDLSYISGVSSSTEVLVSGKGVCDEYANLAAAFFRSKGIPTKFVVGKVFNGQIWENHAWLKVYIPGQGWLHVDPTYGEAGYVDGSHVEYGEFDDHSAAADRITYPASMHIMLTGSSKFSPGSGQDTACVEKAEPFEGLLEVFYEKGKEIGANQFSQLNFTFNNLKDETYLLPVHLVFHQDFEVDGKRSEIVLFTGLASLEKVLLVKPVIDLASATYATYPFKIVLPDQTVEGTVTVLPEGTSVERSSIELVQVIPLVSEEEVVLKLEFKNNSFKDEVVLVEFEGLPSLQETLPPKVTSIFSVKLPRSIEEVTLHATGPGLDEWQTITIQETIPLIPSTQDVSEQMDVLTSETEDYIRQATGIDFQGNLLRATLALLALIVAFFALRLLRKPLPPPGKK